jgi:hypothetical protein
MNSLLFQIAILSVVICLSLGADVVTKPVITTSALSADPLSTDDIKPEFPVTEIASNLLEAVLKSDIDMIEKAIADGEDINVSNINGW